MGFNRSNAEGCASRQPFVVTAQVLGAAHLIANLATPLNHLWYRLLVHAPARLAYRIDNREVGLQRVQCRNGSLQGSVRARIRMLVGPTA